jgi:hypothetical protein
VAGPLTTNGEFMSNSTLPPRDVLVDMYRRATLIKQNDERFRSVIKSGKLGMVYY